MVYFEILANLIYMKEREGDFKRVMGHICDKPQDRHLLVGKKWHSSYNGPY